MNDKIILVSGKDKNLTDGFGGWYMSFDIPFPGVTKKEKNIATLCDEPVLIPISSRFYECKDSKHASHVYIVAPACVYYWNKEEVMIGDSKKFCGYSRENMYLDDPSRRTSTYHYPAISPELINSFIKNSFELEYMTAPRTDDNSHVKTRETKKFRVDNRFKNSLALVLGVDESFSTKPETPDKITDSIIMSKISSCKKYAKMTITEAKAAAKKDIKEEYANRSNREFTLGTSYIVVTTDPDYANKIIVCDNRTMSDYSRDFVPPACVAVMNETNDVKEYYNECYQTPDKLVASVIKAYEDSGIMAILKLAGLDDKKLLEEAIREAIAHC